MSADGDTEQQSDEVTADVEPSADVEIPADVETPDDVEPTAGVEIDSDEGSGARRRRINVDALPAIPVIPLVLLLALLAAGGLTASLYFTQYRPEEQSDAAVAKIAVDAARDGTVALLSYKPETLNQDVAAARSHLTGDFLNYYDTFTKQVVIPAAKEKALTTTAQVVGAAASEVHPSSAVVLVFVNQVTTSRDRPDPAMASSSVLVSLTKLHGSWLITKFEPI